MWERRRRELREGMSEARGSGEVGVRTANLEGVKAETKVRPVDALADVPGMLPSVSMKANT